MAYIDISLSLTSETVSYPGDPGFVLERLSNSASDGYSLHQLKMSNHYGTHIDFPAHLIANGKTSSDYSLNDLILDCIVVEIPFQAKSITKELIAQLPLINGSAVLFKTENSKLYAQHTFCTNYVYLEEEAAQALIDAGVKIVGVDYLSPDRYNGLNFPVHNLLLTHDVLIVEGLYLEKVASGAYKLFIVPLKIPNLDGLPARVFLRSK